MAGDLQTEFSTDEGDRAYCQAVKDLIRAEQHDQAENMLLSGLATLRVPLAELCLDTQDTDVELPDWKALQQMIFHPVRNGGLCTAVGLDLSNYAAKEDSTPEGWVEPDVEVPFYSDAAFPFSTSSRDEILAANAHYPVPWHGKFENIGPFAMQVVGLAQLNSELKSYTPQNYPRPRPGQPSKSAPAEYIAFKLAEWYRALRYNQTVKRYLDQEGLARRIPVIVGSHGGGPSAEAVYYPAPSRESAEEAETRMHVAREAERRALYEDQARRLWDRADGVREMRKAIRETRFWPNRYMRKLRAHYESNEASTGTLNKLGSPKRPSWRIADDAEFERFLKEFYVDPFLKQWLN